MSVTRLPTIDCRILGQFESWNVTMSINLLYHDITEARNDDASGFPGPAAARYKLTRAEFERHLDRIATVVHQPPISQSSIDAITRTDRQAWMITFDDG